MHFFDWVHRLVCSCRNKQSSTSWSLSTQIVEVSCLDADDFMFPVENRFLMLMTTSGLIYTLFSDECVLGFRMLSILFPQIARRRIHSKTARISCWQVVYHTVQNPDPLQSHSSSTMFWMPRWWNLALKFAYVVPLFSVIPIIILFSLLSYSPGVLRFWLGWSVFIAIKQDAFA